MCISSRDLNYARNNSCGSLKGGVDFAEIQQMFLFCFIYECNSSLCLSMLRIALLLTKLQV